LLNQEISKVSSKKSLRALGMCIQYLVAQQQ
jgi:hypothetical protein